MHDRSCTIRSSRAGVTLTIHGCCSGTLRASRLPTIPQSLLALSSIKQSVDNPWLPESNLRAYDY